MDIYEQCKTEVKQHTKSKIESVLLELDKKDAESLKKALLDETIPSRAIARVLEQNSIECGIWAINQWRKKNGVKIYSSSMTKGAIKK
jgi:16S rRNA U1498 N3-methylase RsmE